MELGTPNNYPILCHKKERKLNKRKKEFPIVELIDPFHWPNRAFPSFGILT